MSQKVLHVPLQKLWKKGNSKEIVRIIKKRNSKEKTNTQRGNLTKYLSQNMLLRFVSIKCL